MVLIILIIIGALIGLGLRALLKVKSTLVMLLIPICLTAGSYLLFSPSNTEDKYNEMHEKTNAALEVAEASPVINVEQSNVQEQETKTGDVLGSIKIPSVKIELAIIEGSTEENLYKGATTLIEGKSMGQGNYSLAGHHMKDDSLFFSQLENMNNGDNIFLTDNKQIYIYKATKQLTIHESETEVLNNHAGKKEITLITCDRPISTEYRTVIKGELIKTVPYSEEEWKKLN